MERILQNSFVAIKDIGFVQYTIKIFVSIAVTFGICSVLSIRDNVFFSYLLCTLAFALATWMMSYIFLGNSKCTKVIMMAYWVKVLIGLIHYLVFFDLGYFFSSGHNLMYANEEFGVVFEAIISITKDKIQYGLWYTNDFDFVFATHPEMMHILSFPFVFFGDNILTISPFNAWCSSIVCISFVCIGRKYLNFSDEKMRLLTYLIAFFPFFIISSYLARDIAGLAAMSMGVTMFLLSDKVLFKCISLVAALYLFYLHRTIYPIVLLVAVAFVLFIGKSKKALIMYALFAVIIVVVINSLAETLLPFVFTENDMNMYDATKDAKGSNLLVTTVLFFIGPLWRQMFTAPEYSYALQETFVIVLMDASFIALWKCRQSITVSKVNSLMILGLLLLVIGGFNSSAHVPYIAVGVLFLIPFVVDVCKGDILIKRIKNVAIILVLVNILSLFVRFGVF